MNSVRKRQQLLEEEELLKLEDTVGEREREREREVKLTGEGVAELAAVSGVG